MASSHSEAQILRQISELSQPPTDAQSHQASLAKAPQLIKKIKRKSPESASDNFKLQAVQFFIHYYTLRMFSLAPQQDPGMNPMMGMPGMPGEPPRDPSLDVDPEQLEIFKNDQARDFEYAWALLSSSFHSDDFQRTAHLLKIEIGQRLESSLKLAQALDDLNEYEQAHPSNNPMETMPMKMIAFTAAPLVGRWGEFIEMGEGLPPMAFEQFSQVAQSMPVPDYSVLYEMAKAANAQDFPVPDPEELPWEQLHIASIRVKFQDLDCGTFEAKREELLAEIHAQDENVKWEEVPNPGSIHLRRMGSVYQCFSFSETPQQLCGMYRDNQIHVKGSTQAVLGPPEIDPALIMSGQVQVNPEDLQVLVQEEEWNLTRSEEDPQFFTGTYRMHNFSPNPMNEPITDADKAPLTMMFELQVRLCSAEQAAEIRMNEINNPKPEAEIEAIVTEFDDLELD